MCVHVECRGFESHPRQLIFLKESDCLGCAVLLCLVVCMTLLASFFLPSRLIKTCIYVSVCTYVCKVKKGPGSVSLHSGITNSGQSQ